MHKVVDYGKNLGIKKIMFSGKQKQLELTNADKKAAFNLIKDDIKMLENAINLDLYSWKTTWQEYELESENTAVNNY